MLITIYASAPRLCTKRGREWRPTQESDGRRGRARRRRPPLRGRVPRARGTCVAADAAVRLRILRWQLSCSARATRVSWRASGSGRVARDGHAALAAAVGAVVLRRDHGVQRTGPRLHRQGIGELADAHTRPLCFSGSVPNLARRCRVRPASANPAPLAWRSRPSRRPGTGRTWSGRPAEAAWPATTRGSCRRAVTSRACVRRPARSS